MIPGPQLALAAQERPFIPERAIPSAAFARGICSAALCVPPPRLILVILSEHERPRGRVERPRERFET
jgi:hypothetical protein